MLATLSFLVTPAVAYISASWSKTGAAFLPIVRLTAHYASSPCWPRLLSPNPASAYFFEEIDNGIHPARLHLLIDLIERQTAKNGVQVITTTHSPDMLNFINDTTFKNTSVLSRLEDTEDTIIRSLDSLHNARELRESQGLGRLHSTGWMEDILNLEAWRIKDEEVGE